MMACYLVTTSARTPDPLRQPPSLAENQLAPKVKRMKFKTV